MESSLPGCKVAAICSMEYILLVKVASVYHIYGVEGLFLTHFRSFWQLWAEVNAIHCADRLPWLVLECLMRASASAAGVVLARLHVKMNHSRLKLGTCESFFSFESNRPVLRQQLFTLYTYSEYLIHRYFVFVTNESDVRTTELRTEYLFISIQS